jgi:hypothetical protein
MEMIPHNLTILYRYVGVRYTGRTSLRRKSVQQSYRLKKTGSGIYQQKNVKKLNKKLTPYK